MVAKEQGRSFPSPAPSLGGGVFSVKGQGRFEDVTRSPAPGECGVRRRCPRAAGRGLGAWGPHWARARPLDRRRVQLASLVLGASVMGYKRGGKLFLLAQQICPPSLLTG